MPIYGDSHIWNEDNINNVRAESGVYAFFDLKGECIYIGESSNLKGRLKGYWNTKFSEEPCKKDTADFMYEYIKNHKERQDALLLEYTLEHNGKYPRCNKQKP